MTGRGMSTADVGREHERLLAKNERMRALIQQIENTAIKAVEEPRDEDVPMALAAAVRRIQTLIQEWRREAWYKMG